MKILFCLLLVVQVLGKRHDPITPITPVEFGSTESPTIGVFLINFSGKLCGSDKNPEYCKPGFTLNELRDRLFANPNHNMRAFFEKMSNGKLKFRIFSKNFHKVTLDDELIDISHDLFDFVYDETDVDPEQFDHSIFIFPLNWYRLEFEDPNNSGFGEFPGKYSWIRSNHVDVIYHEIGHNIGLGHAGAYKNHKFDEYADPTSIMGSDRGKPRRSLNCIHRMHKGWIFPQDIHFYNPNNPNNPNNPKHDTTPTESVQLVQLNSAKSGKRVIVLIPNGSSDVKLMHPHLQYTDPGLNGAGPHLNDYTDPHTVFIEFRQNIGHDLEISRCKRGTTSRVLIHKHHKVNEASTKLVDSLALGEWTHIIPEYAIGHCGELGRVQIVQKVQKINKS